MMNKEYVLFLYSISCYNAFYDYLDTENVIEVCVNGADLSDNEFCAKAYAIASSELAKKYPDMVCLNLLKLLQRYSKKKFRTEKTNG